MGRLLRWLLATHLLAPALFAAPCSPAAMKPNDSQKGTLNERDCRMSDAFKNTPGDNAYVDVYAVTIAEAGVLTVEASAAQFPALVRLYDGRGRRLGGTESSARLRADVQAGRYSLYVTSEGVKTGTYTVSTAFKTTPTCVERRLAPDGEIHGDLSMGDCRHPISLKLRGTLIAELQASDAELILRQGRDEVQRDSARIVREMEGDFTLVVHPIRPRGGAYTLQTVFCPVARELSLNTTAAGTVSEACRAATGDGPQNYSLKLATGALVSLEVQGHGVEPSVALSGPGIEPVEGKPTVARALGAGTWTVAVKPPKSGVGSYSLTARSLCPMTEIRANSSVNGAYATGGCDSGAILKTGDSAPGFVYSLRTDQNCEFAPEIEPKGSGKATLLDVAGKPLSSPLLQPGEYLVLISAAVPAAKQFRLETRCRRVCVAADLRLNEIQEGRLTQNECLLSDLVSPGDASLARAYRFELPRMATVFFELPGSDAGASLMLFKADGGNKELIEQNRAIRRTLESGSYQVMVKSSNAVAYRLRASVPCTANKVETDQPVPGVIAATDCYDGLGSYFRRYLIVPERSSVLEVSAASKTFEPVLKLSDPNGVRTSGPAIRYIVETGGEYTVQVSAASDSGAGAFEITRKLFPLRELEPGQASPVAEFLDPDCGATTCVHYYRVRLEGDVAIRLDLNVRFAPILELLDANLKSMATGETEVRRHVDSGRYIIRVSTKSRTYGSYVLTAGAAGN